MLTILGDSLNEVWLTLLRELYDHPEYTPTPRHIETREITGVTLRINDLRNNILYCPLRNLNYRFQIAEWLWMAFGREDLKTLTPYNGQMSRFSDDGQVLAGAYGPRLKSQWKYVIESIQRDYHSRQAVATIWTPNPAPSKDIPCTIALQFIARQGQLHCITTMRSSDVWLGLPYDVGTFSLLANGIAGVIGLKPGYIQMQLGSSHLYEDNFEKAREVLEDSSTYLGIRSPVLPHWPDAEPRIEQPISLGDVLDNPKKWVAADHQLPYPWGMYADVLNANSWTHARQILQGAHD